MKAYQKFLQIFAFREPDDEARHFGLAHVAILLSLAPFILSFQLFRLIEPEKSASLYAPVTSWYMQTSAPVRPVPFKDDQLSARFEAICGATEGCANSLYSNLMYLGSVAQLPSDESTTDWFNYVIYRAMDEEFAQWRGPFINPTAYKTDSLAGLFTEQIDDNLSDQQLFLLFGSFLLLPICLFELYRRKLLMATVAGFAIPLGFLVILGLIGLGLVSEQSSSARFVIFDVLPKVALLWLAWKGRLLARPVVGTIAVLACLSIYSVLPENHDNVVMGALGIIVLLFAVLAKGWPALQRSGLNKTLKTVFKFLLGALGVFAGLAALLWIYGVWADGLVLSILKGLVPIVLFVLLLTLLRLLVMSAVTNSYFLRNMGLGRTLRVAAFSFALWIPMLCLAAPYFVFTEHVLPEKVTNALHEGGHLPRAYPHPFRDNALQASAGLFDEILFDTHVSFERLKANVRYQANVALSNGLEKPTLAAFDSIMPAQLNMKRVETNAYLGGVKAAANLAQDGVQGAYGGMRSSMRGKLAEKIKGYDVQFRGRVKEGRDAILTRIDEAKLLAIGELEEQNRIAASAIWSSMLYVYAMHTIGLLLFAMICVKSFLYVFARVAFHRGYGTALTLSEFPTAPAELPPPHIVQTGSQYLIPDRETLTFFVSRRFQCRGKAPRLAIPQPFHAPVARLLHGATTMNKVEMFPGSGTVSCTATRGAEFIEWNLRPGEAVVFDFHNFVAMTEELKISTLISTRLSSLLLGKFIFSLATGPGKLVLMTDGRAEVTGDSTLAESLPPQRLVAMNREAWLNVESELNVVDVYLSDAYVRPTGGARVIVDVDSQRGNGPGLARFILHFLWPG